MLLLSHFRSVVYGDDINMRLIIVLNSILYDIVSMFL